MNHKEKDLIFKFIFEILDSNTDLEQQTTNVTPEEASEKEIEIVANQIDDKLI